MSPILKTAAFTLIAPATVAGYAPYLITRGESAPAGATRVIGLLCLAAGATIYLWCAWEFATRGGGTPSPLDAPKALVAQGLYRYTRNPMYVGVLTAIAGWAILFHSARLAAYGLIVFACAHAFVVLHEEPHLHAVFGAEYDAYRARVGRWLTLR